MVYLAHLQNLRKNLGARLGSRSKEFFRDFAIAQEQISEKTFLALYDSLRERFLDCASYLDKELSKNVKYWASCYCDAILSLQDANQHNAEKHKIDYSSDT